MKSSNLLASENLQSSDIAGDSKIGEEICSNRFSIYAGVISEIFISHSKNIYIFLKSVSASSSHDGEFDACPSRICFTFISTPRNLLKGNVKLGNYIPHSS